MLHKCFPLRVRSYSDLTKYFMSPCIISHFRSIFNSARSISPAIDIFLSLCTIRKIKIGIFDKQNRPLFAPFTPKLSKRVQGKSKNKQKPKQQKPPRKTENEDERRGRRTKDERCTFGSPKVPKGVVGVCFEKGSQTKQSNSAPDSVTSFRT